MRQLQNRMLFAVLSFGRQEHETSASEDLILSLVTVYLHPTYLASIDIFTLNIFMNPTMPTGTY